MGPTLASHDSTCTIKFTSLLRSAKAGLTDVGTKFTTSLEWDVFVADADEKVRSEMPATSVEMRSYARPRGHVPGEGGVGGALATCFWPAGCVIRIEKRYVGRTLGAVRPGKAVAVGRVQALLTEANALVIGPAAAVTLGGK